MQVIKVLLSPETFLGLLVIDTIVVTFLYVPAMGVTDKAGNTFNATINFATGVVAAISYVTSPVICYYRAYCSIKLLEL